MTGGELTHTLVSLRDGLRSACAPCAARGTLALRSEILGILLAVKVDGSVADLKS